MKIKQLIIPVLILTLAACKKDLKPSESTNAMQKIKINSKMGSFASNFTSDSYKISGIISTYPSNGTTVSHIEQTNYAYTPGGKLSKIITVSTSKTKGPRIPGTQPIAFDTLTLITNTTLDYTYASNMIHVKWVSTNNYNTTSHWETTYILNDAGKVTRDTVRIFNTSPNNGNSIGTDIYTYQNLPNGNSQVSSVNELGGVYTYNLAMDNLTSQTGGYNTTPAPIMATYSFFTDKDSQPADALTLNKQLSEYGYAPIISKNLTQSASANNNAAYTSGFNSSYGINSSAYISYVDVKFDYEYDNTGRIIKITETGRKDRNSTTPYQILRTRLITYLN